MKLLYQIPYFLFSRKNTKFHLFKNVSLNFICFNYIERIAPINYPCNVLLSSNQ